VTLNTLSTVAGQVCDTKYPIHCGRSGLWH